MEVCVGGNERSALDVQFNSGFLAEEAVRRGRVGRACTGPSAIALAGAGIAEVSWGAGWSVLVFSGGLWLLLEGLGSDESCSMRRVPRHV